MIRERHLILHRQSVHYRTSAHVQGTRRLIEVVGPSDTFPLVLADLSEALPSSLFPLLPPIQSFHPSARQSAWRTCLSSVGEAGRALRRLILRRAPSCTEFRVTYAGPSPFTRQASPDRPKPAARWVLPPSPKPAPLGHWLITHHWLRLRSGAKRTPALWYDPRRSHKALKWP